MQLNIYMRMLCIAHAAIAKCNTQCVKCVVSLHKIATENKISKMMLNTHIENTTNKK